MLYFKKKKLRNVFGSATAELSLVLPILLVFTGSIFEISRFYYLQNSLEYGAKQAAKVGSAIRETVDSSYMSLGTVSRTELETLVKNSVRINGVIEEPEQFTIKYFNSVGTEISPVANLPFNRSTNPNAIDYIQVETTYPGMGAGVSSPVPVVFNPGNVFMGSVNLRARAIYKIEGRIER